MKYISTLLISIISMTSFAQKPMPLYAGVIPNSKPTPDHEMKTMENGIEVLRMISRPTLTPYLADPSKATGTAVIVVPGGGYWINASGHEGKDVAEALRAAGITAFVLKYRIPNDSTMVNREIGPLQDAQQAIKVVRERASEWKIDPNSIGILGFSAGGHLASTAGTHFDRPVIENQKNTSLRPDFMVLIYPVISFQDSLAHIGSREQIVGKSPSKEKKDYYSNELQVNSNTPATFLVHATDDNVVKVDNSIFFYEALKNAKVPAELHVFRAGGHGFGMINKTTGERWMDDLLMWINEKGWKK